LLAAYLPHSGLFMLAKDDIGRPLRQHGRVAVISHLAVSELDAVKANLQPNQVARSELQVAGEVRPVFVALAGTGAMLLLTDPGPNQWDALVLHLWQVLALRLQRHVSEASPTYLLESRALSRMRAESVNEVTDLHSTTLETLLAVLRSASVDDRSARQAATNLAAGALVNLRTTTDRVRTSAEEPVATAFERLRDDLRPLVKYRDVGLQFVEPPIDGRALPSEVAHGARAVVRGAILALVDQPDITRARVQWDCDGRNLLIDVRDDGPGELSIDSIELQPLRQRVLALNGQLALTATAGWGSELSVILPLDPPPVRGGDSSLPSLAPRELEVLEHIAAGRRNRVIANQLGISENTVKFHVSKILRKLGVSSRAEVAALVIEGRLPLPLSPTDSSPQDR